MNLVSYAQNLEDIMLWRALKSVSEGFYIDVGANDPETDSVTKLFYDRGWHGINIEPLQQHLKKLRADRPRDINLGCGAGAEPGQLKIWESNVRGWATMDAEVAARHEAEGNKGQWHTVDVRTLADICAEHGPADIHFLKIDVEGFEYEVLRGMDFTRFRPWIVVAEATLPNSRIESYAQWETLLLQAGYLHAYSDGLNRFYVANEHQDLLEALKYPPNVFDAFNTAKTQALHDWALDNEARIKVLQQQVEQMSSEAAALNERLTTQTATLSEQLAQRDAKLDALSADLAEREARLADMFYSTSWRVTAPLRWLGIQRTRLQEQGLKSRLRRGAVQAARLGIRFVRARPGLRSALARLAHKTGLYGPLFRLYSRMSQATAADFSPHFVTPPADALLTPRGRRVYNDLLQTLRKENH
ncbi:FkbM family methyltransferase [Bordetella genomosp. 4]|nr:FkbM family methyltransferase [Bordetella genomosp. 4]